MNRDVDEEEEEGSLNFKDVYIKNYPTLEILFIVNRIRNTMNPLRDVNNHHLDAFLRWFQHEQYQVVGFRMIYV